MFIDPALEGGHRPEGGAGSRALGAGPGSGQQRAARIFTPVVEPAGLSVLPWGTVFTSPCCPGWPISCRVVSSLSQPPSPPAPQPLSSLRADAGPSSGLPCLPILGWCPRTTCADRCRLPPDAPKCFIHAGPFPRTQERKPYCGMWEGMTDHRVTSSSPA